MSLAAIQVAVELEQFVCGECGGTYAIAERVARQKREKSGYWHCPYCQCSWGYGKGELQRAREELDAEKQRHMDTLARLNEQRAQAERIAKDKRRIERRIHAGVCPCCNRTFQNLARHMATKHPGSATPADQKGEG